MIYKATLKDIEDIVDMAMILFDSHKREELRQEFLSLLNSDENCAVFIATSNQTKIGFAQVQMRHDYVEGTQSSPVGYLEGIFIKEEYRKHGYAANLLKYCEQWAKEKGCTEFASDCELTNTTSLEFHLKVGFSESNRIICFTKHIV